MVAEGRTAAGWWWAGAAVAVAAAGVGGAAWAWRGHRRAVRRLEAAVAKAQALRAEERAGRTKAERQLRNSGPAVGTDASTYPFAPVGTLRSCFAKRNGTPRQPHLVPAARARVVLRKGLQADALSGLRAFGHCWLLYVFHENTDLQRLWQPDRAARVKTKVQVPRLNSRKLGVFASRSPHRPNPIGLSTARVLDVVGDVLVLGGCDLVDGTPILDIKPVRARAQQRR